MANEKNESNIQEKLIHINRCAKVTSGGRKFSFSALIVAGDANSGRIGFGQAKANELSDSIRKGSEMARRDMVEFEREGTTIPHQVMAEFDGTRVLLKPAPEGTGVIAGSCVRMILELAGVKDVVAKLYGSNNKMNQVRVTFKALAMLRNKKATIEMMRGQA
jgi:small subunit ribosomal protein S5